MKIFRRRGGGIADARPPAGGAGGVSAEDVIRSIEMILGRTPEPALVDYHLKIGFPDRFALGAYMLGTGEFRQRYGAQDHNPAELRPLTIYLGDRVLTRTHRGHLIYVVPGDADLTPSILLYGRWEPGVEAAIVRLLRPGATVIDLGANVGYHTVTMAGAVGAAGRVFAFEANPVLASLLQATIFVNGFDWVSVRGKAVLDRAGRFKLASSPGHFGSVYLITDSPASDYDATYFSQRVEVDAVTLDADLADGIESVDLMHLDIEGSEPLALRGGARLIERSPEVKIVTEWSVPMMGTRTDVPEFVRWLVGLGFGFWRIEGEGRLTAVSPDQALALPHCDLVLARDGVVPP